VGAELNNRRKLVIALGANALVLPFASFAQQQGKLWRMGFLEEIEQSYYVQRIDAFKDGLREFGYTEGKNYAIERRSANNDYALLPALAMELLALKVDLLVTTGSPSAVAAHNATRDIPILTVTISDPVGSGLAASLPRPGGNVTGLTQGVASELYTKRLDLLRQMLPGMRRVGFLYNPENTGNMQSLNQFQSDCDKLKFKSIPAPVRKVQDVVAAFDILKRDKAQALIVAGDSTYGTWRETIIEHAAKHRLPAIYPSIRFVDSGGLISYATNLIDLYRRAAVYADKIFKGAKPGDLPIEQPLKFETVINLKTAKALGIKIPDVVMLRADRVIE
jgi:putative ABC transport system substrate-binding protein